MADFFYFCYFFYWVNDCKYNVSLGGEMSKELGKKLMNIRERAIKDGMKLLSEEEILDEKCSRCKQLRTENERLKKRIEELKNQAWERNEKRR